MKPFRILHLSKLFSFEIPSLLELLKRKKLHGISALVVSGFSKIEPEMIVRSTDRLSKLTTGLKLEPEQVLCMVDADDQMGSISIFNNVLYFPFFGKPYKGLSKFLVQSSHVQILGIPDHLVPGLKGINQDMFNLKIRQGQRRGATKVRLFFSGGNPENWDVRPVLPDPTHSHFPVFLHGDGREWKPQEGYYGIGADANHFNVIEVDDMRINGLQFLRDGIGKPWRTKRTIHHEIRLIACKAN